MSDTGQQLTLYDGESIIRPVARAIGVEAHAAMPRVSPELPLGGERFEGLMPPVLAAQTSAIRKPAVTVVTLDNYARSVVTDSYAAAVLRAAVLGRRNILLTGEPNRTTKLFDAYLPRSPETLSKSCFSRKRASSSASPRTCSPPMFERLMAADHRIVRACRVDGQIKPDRTRFGVRGLEYTRW